MSTAFATAFDLTDLTDNIREVFSQVTRYPQEILDPAASLEDELGIDSVKLGEVFAVLRERYNLAEQVQIPREQLRTIASIAQGIREHLSQGPSGQRSSAMPGLNGHSSPAVHEGSVLSHEGSTLSDVQHKVRDIFSAVTRYPEDILDPHASLEEDLGIDSVKLGEVFAVLREQYGLPQELDMPRERMRTIAGISESLAEYVRGREDQGRSKATVTPELNGHERPEASRATVNGHELAGTVRSIFAEVTRYPLDILDPKASLEEDLGIDSVKLGEIFAVLRERYQLPADVEIGRESLRTIAGVTEALERYLGKTAPADSQQTVLVKSLQNGHGGNGTAPLSSALVNSFASLSALRKPFEGKVALVTGSGRGLGRDIAMYLAELGASVIVNSFHSREQGIKTVEDITSAGGKAIHAWGSVANQEQLGSIFDLVDKTFGGLDFFISNASNGMLARLKDITVEHWEKAFRTNVVGLHQSALRAVELMKRRGGGKIITLSSPASHGYVDYFGCMGTVKAAVESLTKSMAIEFAPHNIRVNCVSPGPIYGELLNKWPESKRLIAEWEDATVCERLCEDRDVSHFIAYLLSDPVKLFTGSVLVMDGGISVRWG